MSPPHGPGLLPPPWWSCQNSSHLVGREVRASLNSHQLQHVAFGVPYKHLISQHHLMITAIWIHGSMQELIWLMLGGKRWHWFCTGASSGFFTTFASIAKDWAQGRKCEGLILPSYGYIPNCPWQPRNADPSCTEMKFHFGIFSHKALLFYAAQLCTQMPSIYNFQWKVNEMASLLSCQKYNWNANFKTFSKIAPFCTKILINQKHFVKNKPVFIVLQRVRSLTLTSLISCSSQQIFAVG